MLSGLVAAALFAPPLAEAATTTSSVPPIHWSACPKVEGYQCGTVQVPVNYAHPDGPTIAMAVMEKPASDPTQRIGSLFINPGGPGQSGIQILPVLAALFPAAISQRFDLVSFDERGTGASDKIQCGPSPESFASVDAVPAAKDQPIPGASVYHQLATECVKKYGALLGQINTTNAARDMDRLRQALGESTISYYGTSYGTVLGASYAHQFPSHVRAMVLDGAVDPLLPLTQQATEEAPGIELALQHFFVTCANSSTCLLGSDPKAFYEKLQASIERTPLPAPGNGDNLPVTVGDLDTATLYYLSVPVFAGSFQQALVAASQGNGAPLRGLSLTFQQDIDGTALDASMWTLTCEDAANHPGAVAAGNQARTLAHLGAGVGAVAPSYLLGGCVDWPKAVMPVASIEASHTSPLLVIGNVGDPNTPHRAAIQLTKALGHSASLLTWDGYGHTWLLNGTSDTCMTEKVVTYLDSVTPPANGSVCS